MTIAFLEKVIRHRIYDTKQYRYIVNEGPEGYEISRIAIKDLDTTNALNPEKVCTYIPQR